MTITVKFFASLRESLGISEANLNPKDVKTVTDVWSLATENAEMPVNTLIAINMDYVDSSQDVKDGDEVAFFPPVSAARKRLGFFSSILIPVSVPPVKIT